MVTGKNFEFLRNPSAKPFSLHNGRHLFYQDSGKTTWKTPYDIRYNYNNTNNKIYIHDIELKQNIATFSNWNFPFYIDSTASFVLLFCCSDSSTYPSFTGSIKKYDIAADSMVVIVDSCSLGFPQPIVVDNGRLVWFNCRYYVLDNLLIGELCETVVSGCHINLNTSTGNWIKYDSGDIIEGNLFDESMPGTISSENSDYS